jgi:exodeoxyribonuclease VII large subunit
MTTVAEPPVQARAALTVGAVIARLRGSLEREFPDPIWVEGELSNCSFPSSGHIYFSLKDEREMDGRGQPIILPCTFFRHANQFVRFKLEDGLKVLCQGQVGIYEAHGKYQLKVTRVEPKGIGALQLAFEQLKKRLAAEGLFDEARKRPIPELPERVAIVTSLTGSAVHDMVVRLREHFHVIILPAKVQGEGAAREIAEAIREANARRIADVLIVGRGGGSLEDLWCFNEEPVARAIASSEIPVISAVGHEDHWTIADYVADQRASTPTHAAQALAHARLRLTESLQLLTQQLVEAMHASLADEEQRLDGLREQLRLLHPMVQINEHTTRVQEQLRQITQSARHALDGYARHLQGLIGRLDALSPLAVLARGYSITLAGLDRRVVTSASSVKPGDELETMLARGRVFSTVSHVLPEDGKGNHQ